MPEIVERISNQDSDLSYHEHTQRYQFAEIYLKPGCVLDIASGTGYGTHMIAQHAGTFVVGVDLDQPSLLRALKDYSYHGVSFLAASGDKLPFHNQSFQTIVTLETIEHIYDEHGFLRELTRVLSPAGSCILSTPNREHSERHNRINPYHVREYSEPELVQLLQTYFADVTIFYQGLTSHYQDQIRDYAASIQHSKSQLNPILRLIINRVYRPVKQHIPVAVSNLFIRRLLGKTLPQPQLTHMQIAQHPFEDTSAFIAVCKQSLAISAL
jgi:ubiquinone/menaquinone biosynthesis C-methylase UbiE